MKFLIKKIIVFILILESRLIIKKYNPFIVAVTGSVGKTSTKDAIYTILANNSYVRKSEKSYNSQIGLPLTILGIPNAWNNPGLWLLNILRGLWLIIYPHKYPAWLVLEVGVGKPGDMAETASWLATDIVVMTTIPETPVHIEFFNSRKHLVEEKAGLIKTLKPTGVLVLNADDETVLDMKNKTRNIIVTYGFNPEATLSGSEDNIYYEGNVPKGITFRVDEGGKSLPVVMEGVFGKNHIYSALAALACAHVTRFNILESIDMLRIHNTPPGRMKVLLGINDSTIIDDTYNSSPVAAEAAVETLGKVSTPGRKIAVLGDMLELGRHTDEAHRKLGELAKKNTDILVVVGPRAKFIKEGAEGARMAKKNIFEFNNSKEAAEFMSGFASAGDLILVKGSQGVRMERVTAALLQDKQNAAKLLVRQEEEWLGRN
jgi:UDP-N-acetylmuramoyl-tripeptide--D-alanyl-D-alanine ligase